VPITTSGASVDAILAAAARVQNVLPEGSTWDGKSDLPMDEATFQQMLSEKEPDAAAPAAPAADSGSANPPPPQGAAPAPQNSPTAGAAKTQPPTPKNGG
jgi:hypothetical protein